MKVTIVGAGNIGIYIGGFLSNKSIQINFLGRERIREEIKENDLTLFEFQGSKIRISYKDIIYKIHPSEIESSDIFIITVKSQDTISTLTSLNKIIKDDTIIISLQNGVSNFEFIQSIFPRNSIISGMVPYNIFKQNPGIYKRTTSGDLIFQSSIHNSLIDSIFKDSKLSYKFDQNTKGILYGKLIFNLNNPINALCNLPLREELSDQSFRRILSNCMLEALSVLKTAKIKPKSLGTMIPWLAPLILRLPNWLFFKVASNMIKIDPDARSSMWEDLQNKKVTEVDYITGEILKLAKQLNLLTPYNTTIYHLIKVAEVKRNGSPSISAKELQEEINSNMLEDT
jgi:2-dehydropantoate 2-reductase